jgi:HEAT repeat protein
MARLAHTFLVILSFFTFFQFPANSPAGNALPIQADREENILRQANIPLDTPSLLAFVRKFDVQPLHIKQVSHLIRQLGNDKFEVREKASRNLVALGPVALEILQKAQDDPDPEIARRAGECARQLNLEKNRAIAAVRILVRRHSIKVIQSLFQSESSTVRLTCAAAVREAGLNAEEIIQALTKVLGDPVPAVRQEAEDALKEVITPSSLPIILRAAGDKRASVRSSAIYLLFKFQGKPRQIVPVLLRAIQDENKLVRRQAAYRFWPYGSEKGVVPALIKALEDRDVAKDKSEVCVAWIAAESLGCMGRYARPAIPALTKAAKSGGRDLRNAAIGALGRVGRDDKKSAEIIVPLLLGVFKDRHETIRNRCCAAYVLGRIGAPAKCAISEFLKVLRDKSAPDPQPGRGLRDGILYGLAEFGPVAKEALPGLVDILLDCNLPYQETQRAAEALGSIGPSAKAAIPALTIALKHTKLQVRDAAARALEKIKKWTGRRQGNNS